MISKIEIKHIFDINTINDFKNLINIIYSVYNLCYNENYLSSKDNIVNTIDIFNKLNNSNINPFKIITELSDINSCAEILNKIDNKNFYLKDILSKLINKNNNLYHNNCEYLFIQYYINNNINCHDDYIISNKITNLLNNVKLVLNFKVNINMKFNDLYLHIKYLYLYISKLSNVNNMNFNLIINETLLFPVCNNIFFDNFKFIYNYKSKLKLNNYLKVSYKYKLNDLIINKNNFNNIFIDNLIYYFIYNNKYDNSFLLNNIFISLVNNLYFKDSSFYLFKYIIFAIITKYNCFKYLLNNFKDIIINYNSYVESLCDININKNAQCNNLLIKNKILFDIFYELSKYVFICKDNMQYPLIIYLLNDNNNPINQLIKYKNYYSNSKLKTDLFTEHHKSFLIENKFLNMLYHLSLNEISIKVNFKYICNINNNFNIENYYLYNNILYNNKNNFIPLDLFYYLNYNLIGNKLLFKLLKSSNNKIKEYILNRFKYYNNLLNCKILY